MMSRKKIGVALLISAGLAIAGSAVFFAIGPKFQTVTIEVSSRDDVTLKDCIPQVKSWEVGLVIKNLSDQFVKLDGSWGYARGSCVFEGQAWLPNGANSLQPRVILDKKQFEGSVTASDSLDSLGLEITDTITLRGNLRVFGTFKESFKRECASAVTSYFGGKCGNFEIGGMSYPTSCSGIRGLAKYAKGALVRLENSTGAVVSEGVLSEGLWDWDENISLMNSSKRMVCRFSIEIKDVPKLTSGYSLSAGGSLPFGITWEELESEGFNVELAINQ